MTKVLATYDPTSYAQAKVKTLWEQAMSSKYEYFFRNKTWSFVSLPLGNTLVCCKWVYKANFTTPGQIGKYKARLVIKGFNQLEGIDYNETFSPIAKMNTKRTIYLSHSFHKYCIYTLFNHNHLTIIK